MSGDSRCLSFDDKGSGYAKGEGFGALILKPLKDAVADGDTVRAVIRSTTTNQDGRTPGITQPSLAAQEEQIRAAYKLGGLDLDYTRLFEAHGTGTAMGDPIEAEAIRNVFQKHRSPEDPMYVGAVKSNIGHLEAVAGLAGVIKTILCLEKGIIPPNAGFETLNRSIKADEWHLRFPTKPLPWPSQGLRRASVNSFGYGGSNAHVVLDDAYNALREFKLQGNHCTVEAPPAEVSDSGKQLPPNGSATTNGVSKESSNGEATNGHSNGTTKNKLQLFTLSTSDSAGVERIGEVYRDYLSQRQRSEHDPSSFLRDLSFTLANKRSALPWKSFISANSYEDLVGKLSNMPKAQRSSVPPKLNFIFTGQGAQWATMGLGLLSNPLARDSILQAENHFKSLGSDWSLIEELERPAESSTLGDPALAQPSCTAIQVALVDLLASWGVQPQGVVGHSSGEIAGAYCAGAIDRESAWTIAYFRGALAAKLAKAPVGSKERGAMMAVQLTDEELGPYLEELSKHPELGDVAIGCENAASNLTLTGSETAIDFLKERLDVDQIFARKLTIPVAYHSSHMQVIADDYLKALQSIRPPQIQPSTQEEKGKKPSLTFVSSVTGDTISLEELAKPEYWVSNLTSRVRFVAAITRLHAASPDATSSVRNQPPYCIEIGPHPAMQKPVRDTIKGKDGFQYEASLKRGVDARESLLDLAGRLFVANYPIDIQAVNAEGDAAYVEQARMLPDLPKYPFNHSQTYWLESRLVKNYRQRDAIRHELLGLPVTDWNPLMPRWRHTIRSGDHPWLQDHQLDGTILYPGAGMLSMVVEGARHMAKFKPQLVLKGYRFREVTIHSALVVPSDGSGVEVQLYMQNQKNNRTTGITTIECREFHLSGYVGGEWKGVCSGNIITEYAEQAAGIYDPEEDAQRTINWAQSRMQEIVQNCPAKANEERVYRMGQKIGYHFGPAFQTLSEISYDPNGKHSVATVGLDDWQSKLATKPSVEPHVIHPKTLDGVLQTMSVMTNKGGTEEAPLHAPTQFKEIWISHRLFEREADTKIRVGAKTTRYAVRDLDASITALHAETQEPLLTIDGYRVTTLSTQFYEPSERRNLFYRLQWKPDVELVEPQGVQEYCVDTAGKRLVWDPEQQVVCLYYLTRTLDQLGNEGFRSPKEHLQKYQSWIKYHLEGLGDQNPLLQSPWKERLSPENIDSFMAQFTAKGRVEKALHDFCAQLPQIVKEEVDPLHLLFNEGLANDIYSDDVFVYTGKRAAAYVELVAHKNPNMDILEIGAGTGTATDPILESLLPEGDRQGTPKYNSYTFTDISPSFFEKAQARLSHHADRMVYKTLDVEQDPTTQGFEKGKYDMVVAAAVLHATANIKETLRNAHSLLKPGGYIVLVEPTNKWGTVSDSVWGTLSGWWRSNEDDRQHGPLYEWAQWDARLKETGFTGIETKVPDHPEKYQHTLSLLVSRMAPTETTSHGSSRSITILAGTELQQQVASEMASALKDAKLVSNCDIVSPTSLERNKLDVLVSLVELEEPVFGAMTDANLNLIKLAVDSASQVYWLTSGGGPQASQPEKAMASGFSRAITQEHPGLWFANLDVADIKTAAKTFVSIFQRDTRLEEQERELDYHVSSDEVISIPRAVEAGEINEFVHSQTGKLPIETRTVGKAETHVDALELQYSIGQLESFRFVKDESVYDPLPDDEVEVEIKATGVNFIDVMVLLGQLAGTHFGCEYSGIVSRVGSAVTNLKLGDRVCFLGEDGFRSFVRCKAGIAARIPDSLPFTEVFAAVYLTTIHSLNHVAALQKGESILVHAAAGGVGQAAIQLAQHIGADVFVTVSSQDKKKLMTEHYGIPENRIFYSRNLSFGRQIKQATGGRGVDVVLNSTSGEALAESFRLLAPLGRFVEIGKRDIHTFQNLPMSPFLNNVSYTAVNTKSVEHTRPQEMRDLVLELEDMLAKGIFYAPRPVSVFARGQFESAIRYLQSGRHMGKAVVDWDVESEIPMVPSPDPATKLDPNASYVIAGGLGGIGRSMAAWFGRKGVKHLILLSRSGPVTDPAINLVESLRSRGVNVATPKCDVSDQASLKEAIDEATKTMPPVKGVIQASMVLRVCISDSESDMASCS